MIWNRGWVKTLVLAGCLSVAVAHSNAWAIEVQFRSQADVARPLLLLGDIAEVLSVDERQVEDLSSIELFPAPVAGRTRLLRAREIQDLLKLRGVDLSDVRFGGASVIEVRNAQRRAVVASAAVRPGQVNASQLEPAVVEAICHYLLETVDENSRWTAEVRLTNEAVELLASCGNRLTATGGRPPWTGRQRFLIGGQASGKIRQAVVEAVVSVPESVVVAARSIPRGRVIRAADLRLEPAQPGSRSIGAVASIEDVIGKEATRSLVAGNAVDARSLRMPILVRRGEVLRVTVHVSNVTITTNARAMDEGSQGDLIEVQALDSRERFVAHVTGIQEVAVYPRRIQVASVPRENVGRPRHAETPATPAPVPQAVWPGFPPPSPGCASVVLPANYISSAREPTTSVAAETGR